MCELSIVIPTRNRAYTLVHLLESLLVDSCLDFEIIVCDNSNERLNNIEKYLQDPRLIYHHSSEPLQMKENCEYAISLASGEFMCMLGDDDGLVLTEVEKVICYLKKHNLEYALSSDATYYWPGLNRRLFGVRDYGFEASYKFSQDWKKLDSKAELKKVINEGACKISYLPRLYQGIVKSSVIEKIKIETGAVFNAPMPDMSSSIAIALTTRHGLVSPVPFVINGVSENSGGGKGAAGKHSGLIKDAYGLSQTDKDMWPTEIYAVWSGGTVWAASAFLTLKKFDERILAHNINTDAIAGYLVAFHPSLFIKHIGLGDINLRVISVALRSIVARFISLIRNLSLYIKLTCGFGVRANNIRVYVESKQSSSDRHG
jgi:glycosyltransferase involved in cell wall biosynthesis